MLDGAGELGRSLERHGVQGAAAGRGAAKYENGGGGLAARSGP
ncbi:hypothetical protein ACIRRX_32750 [Streptomyces bacillaris]